MSEPVESGDRIAKALARAGAASRREIERMIAEGRVAINGKVLTHPAVKVAPGDILTIDGKPVEEAEPARVFRYHKPVGLLTSHNDPKGRPTVFASLPPGLPRLISVGRLDLNSEGLLLLTNDGGLSRALEMPSTGWVRRYRARAYGGATQEKLDRLADGLTIEGVHYGPIEAKLDKASGANCWISVALNEGKNREVRRVLEHLGLKVNRLIRLAYGPFALGVLPPGAVEEVGPRVIREQLADFIAPANMPKGERPAFKGFTPGPARRTQDAKAGETRTGEGGKPRGDGKTRPEKPKIEYKAGWAKPKKKAPIGPGKPPRKPRKP